MIGGTRSIAVRGCTTLLCWGLAACGYDGAKRPGTGEDEINPEARSSPADAGGRDSVTARDVRDASKAVDARKPDAPAADRVSLDTAVVLAVGECRTSADCAPDEYCYLLGTCPPSSYACQNGFDVYCKPDPGNCRPKPQCNDSNRPICGCDGKNYQNSCFANQGGTMPALDHPCP